MTEQEQQAHYAKIVQDRRIVNGPSSELMAISPMKHAWARDTWRQMLANTWFATEIDMTRDIYCYRRDLTEGEKRAYDYALSFVSNLDGIQLHNIVDNIGSKITSPEVLMLTTRQAYEEALHVDAYSTIIEAISASPMSVYMKFEQDGMLARKNEYIMRQSRLLGSDDSTRTFVMACIANVALEGIYFFSAFLTFYALGKRGKMLSTADQIKFINRDEVAHMSFFIQMIETLKVENPEVFADPTFWQDAEALIRSAVELEIEWGKYIIQDGVLGLSDSIVTDYIQHLGNDRWQRITGDSRELYPNVKNPVGWVDDFSNINKEEANFFEGKVKAYEVGGTLSDW